MTEAPFDFELTAFIRHGHVGDRWQVAPLHKDGSRYASITSERLTREQAFCFAAAPDLLAAGEAVIAELDSEGDFENWERCKANLRAAIAKARGEV